MTAVAANKNKNNKMFIIMII